MPSDLTKNPYIWCIAPDHVARSPVVEELHRYSMTFPFVPGQGSDRHCLLLSVEAGGRVGLFGSRAKSMAENYEFPSHIRRLSYEDEKKKYREVPWPVFIDILLGKTTYELTNGSYGRLV